MGVNVAGVNAALGQDIDPDVLQLQRLAVEVKMQIAGKGGNTLDHWAGYSPNPEDAARLLEATGDLGSGALLKPVGSRFVVITDPVCKPDCTDDGETSIRDLFF